MYVVDEEEIRKAVSELPNFCMGEDGKRLLWLTEHGSIVVGAIRKFGIDNTPGVRQLLDWNSDRNLETLGNFLIGKRIMVVRSAGSCRDSML